MNDATMCGARTTSSSQRSCATCNHKQQSVRTINLALDYVYAVYATRQRVSSVYTIRRVLCIHHKYSVRKICEPKATASCLCTDDGADGLRVDGVFGERLVVLLRIDETVHGKAFKFAKEVATRVRDAVLKPTVATQAVCQKEFENMAK